jgi:hypothetical protein
MMLFSRRVVKLNMEQYQYAHKHLKTFEEGVNKIRHVSVAAITIIREGQQMTS